MGFVRTDPVLSVHNQPHRAEPFVQRDWTSFENGSDFDGELLFSRAVVALPNLAAFQEPNVFRFAVWALNAVRPTQRHHEIKSVITNGEKGDRFVECLRKVRVKVR